MKVFILIFYLHPFSGQGSLLIEVPYFKDMQSCQAAGEQLKKDIPTKLDNLYSCVEGWKK